MSAYTSREKGFTLLEMMVALCIIAALASIAIPRYAAYRERAQAAACLSNRYNIEMEERAHFLEQEEPGLTIDGIYKCPSGGVYVWLISDPKEPGYPRVICSLHGEDEVRESVPLTSLGSTFEEIAGGMIDLTKKYYSKYGSYPRSWGDYRYTDIGLDPDEWDTSYEGIIYKPTGNRIAIEPDEGFTFFVTDARGKEQKITPKNNKSLLYSMEDDKWYSKKIHKNTKIDIATLKVVGE